MEQPEKIKEVADKIYAVGFKNGQVEMKNKVLKKINRDWNLVTIHQPISLIMKILKLVNNIKVTSPKK